VVPGVEKGVRNAQTKPDSAETCNLSIDLIRKAERRLPHHIFVGSIDFMLRVGYAKYKFAVCPRNSRLGEIMEWTTPAFEEVCLNCEINSYASAKL
jgi:coenzyme PQQ precursor peptide PqqA